MPPGEKELARISMDPILPGTDLYLSNLKFYGRSPYAVLTGDQIPKNLSKGFVISTDADVLRRVKTETFILEPGEFIFPWGDNFHAQQQKDASEKELGGKVVLILVHDRTQKDTPWLAQTVLRSTMIKATPEELIEWYNKTKEGDPNKLRYRAMVIALTGKPPEQFQSL